MTAAVLSEHGLHAIEVEEAAVKAAARANTLPAAETSTRRRALASERAWLNAFEWSTVQLGSSPNRI